MRITDTPFVRKALLLTKGVYWVWLALWLLTWVHLMFVWTFRLNDANWYGDFSKIIGILFKGKLGEFLFISPFLIPIIFIIISIIRRKISVLELGVIILTWSLILFTFPHIRG